ncbi:hypothetical protein PV328_001079 [Microctonus aethiopoides]|uniref:tRNA:m(4)X modification enzyme TRM13 n=1 Tax=Microctonus aethiopoides TaxID=144406 RepID=A0AA39KX71_9HYME|nr:hypothetical protein PV328_001079 [Microctonus aethiopoides]
MQNISEQCRFFLKRKKRYCRMTVKEENTYCGEHMEISEEHKKLNGSTPSHTRIKCPFDNSHTCYESKLAKHLSVCNAKRFIDANPEYIVSGINRGDVHLDSPQHIPLSNLDQSVLASIIKKVEISYDKLPVVKELILQHDILDEEINNPDYGNNTKKHLIQNSSLLAHLERAKLIQENTCFIEFGAGKGKLTYWLAKVIDDHVIGSTILLVDRSSHRHKNDNKLRNKQCPVNLIRIRVDIADLSLNKIDAVMQSQYKVGIAKHLCGAATDLMIRCLVQLKEFSTVDGLVAAFCCHHRCDYVSYVGKQYLKNCGFLPDEFPILCSITSWATCGTGKNRNDLHSQNKFEFDERESIGRKVKALLNWGRIEYLNSIGFDSHLYHYIKSEISLENVCVIATHVKP